MLDLHQQTYQLQFNCLRYVSLVTSGCRSSRQLIQSQVRKSHKSDISLTAVSASLSQCNQKSISHSELLWFLNYWNSERYNEGEYSVFSLQNNEFMLCRWLRLHVKNDWGKDHMNFLLLLFKLILILFFCKIYVI